MRNLILVTSVLLSVCFSCISVESKESDDLSDYYGFDEIEIIKMDWGIKALQVADFNGDGKNDIAIANELKSRIELLIQKEKISPDEPEVSVDPEDIDINALIPLTRFNRESVAVSQRMYSLVSGDLNSDGMTDFAFYGDPKGLYVILQKAGDSKSADSSKLSWRTRKKIKIDDALQTPNALVCSDLNNDGRDDLVVASRKTIYMILQKDDGSLSEPVKYPVTAAPVGIESADLNGDNINDLILVVSNQEKPLHVRFGMESGQLGPQVEFFIEYPWALELFDIDAAAGDEILSIDSRSGRLLCYRLTTENQQDSDWPIFFYPLPSGESSANRDLVAADFDGDKLTDIVISDPAAAELIYYKQTSGIGLTKPVRFPAYSDITSLSSADIDADGREDIAILSVKEKVIGLCNYEEERLTFPKPIEISGEPLAMELVDIDSDGDTDCVYVSKDVNEVRSVRVIYSLDSKIKKEDNELDILEKNLSNETVIKLEKLTSNPDGLKVVDADQDGLGDILIFDKYNPPPLFVRQISNRNFELVDSTKAQASLIKEASLISIAAANVDTKAGKEILLAQNNFARSLIFSNSQTWTIVDQYNAKSTENNISAVAAFYLDTAESQPAILLLDGQKGQLQILKPDIDNTYRFDKEVEVGQWAAAKNLKIQYGQLTNSNTKSILLFDGEKFAIITPPTAEASPQHLEQYFSYETKIKDGEYGHLAIGDINNDRRADIVTVEYKRNHIEILALDSQYKPVPAMRFKIFEDKSYSDGKNSSKAGVEPRELKIKDVTGDGKEDLVTIIHDRIIIYPQD